MKATEFYKFIEEYNIEWHWHKGDVFLCLNSWDLPHFFNIVSPNLFDDEGIQCNMKHGYIVLFMKYIFDYYEIELIDVFKQENE